MPYILRPIQLHPDDSTLMLIDALRRRGPLERGSNTHTTGLFFLARVEHLLHIPADFVCMAM